MASKRANAIRQIRNQEDMAARLDGIERNQLLIMAKLGIEVPADEPEAEVEEVPADEPVAEAEEVPADEPEAEAEEVPADEPKTKGKAKK